MAAGGPPTLPPEPAATSPASPTGRPWRRGALWALLVAALVAVVAAALWSALAPEPEPELPVLGEVPEFRLENRDGSTVTRADLAGAPWVADFIFTRCAVSCPVMTGRLKRVGSELPDGAEFHKVSFSVDPEHDRPEVLERYAAARQAPDSWLFLTGDTAEIHSLVRDGFKLALDPDTGDSWNPIVHSSRFVLVDADGRIRGYYDAFEADQLARLEHDLARLLDSTA